MQDKIIAAIADCLSKQEVARQKWNGNIVNIPVEWPEGIDINDLATEIAAAIAPLVDAREPELNREKYNKSFLDWLDKYFHREKSMGYRSNTTGVFFTVKELEQRYERANLDKARL